MRKRIYLFILLIIFDFLRAQNNLFEFVFLDCPEEIKINNNILNEEITFEIKLYLQYNGPTTICKKSDGVFQFYTSGDISYLNSKGQVLKSSIEYVDGIKNYFKNLKINKKVNNVIYYFLEGGATSSAKNMLFVPFAKDCIYAMKIPLLDSKHMELSFMKEAIKKKELSRIKIKISQYFIKWAPISGYKIVQGLSEIESLVDINKEIDIKVEYDESELTKK